MKRESIEQLVALELESAEAKFPKHNSAHESYAILLEEFEETSDELMHIQMAVSQLWDTIRKDGAKNHVELFLKRAKDDSIKLIEEAIQLSAMCDRFEKDILPTYKF